MDDAKPDQNDQKDQDDQKDDARTDQDGSVGISDDQLPEDLQPTDDNPLAKPLDEDDDDAGLSLSPDGPQG